jgi:hypothetical protein
MNEGFVIFLNSKLITCFIGGFILKMKSQSIAYLLNGIFWTLKMKCIQYGLHEHAAFKNAKVILFFKVGQNGHEAHASFR